MYIKEMRKKYKMSLAIELLEDCCSKGEPVPSLQVYEMAKNHGIGLRTLKKAKRELKIQSLRMNDEWFYAPIHLNKSENV